MKIIIRDINDLLIEFFSKHLPRITSALPAGTFVECEVAPIFATGSEAIVSPANSFGFMDGGIDGIYRQRFGKQLEERVQRHIQKSTFGEILVGDAFAIETQCDFIPNLVVAPTMRVPSVIRRYNDVFMAMRAAISVSHAHGFKSVIVPGMGTGSGHVPFSIAAHCMAEGIVHALHRRPFPKSWQEVAIEQITREE